MNLFSRPEVRSTRKSFVNFDPPYVVKGSQLYKNSFSKEDHKSLGKLILGIVELSFAESMCELFLYLAE